MTLLALLVIILGIPLPFLPPGFERACILLEIMSPGELERRYFGRGEKLAYAQQTYRELRYAPCVRCADLLPDNETCRRTESFYDAAICHIEEQRLLFGSYRWPDFDARLDALKARREYWERCRVATNPHGWMADRRRALMWLRDH